MKKINFLLFVFIPSIIICQWEQKIDSLNIDFGVSFESSILFYEQKIRENNQSKTILENFPVNLYLFLKLYRQKDYGFKIKSGILLANNELKAVELELNYYYYFLANNLFGMLGFNIHKPMAGSSNSTSSFDANTYFLAAILGYKTNTILEFTIGYYYRLSTNPYFEKYNYEVSPVYLNHMLKIGIGINF